MKTNLISSTSSACIRRDDVIRAAHICSALLAVGAFGLLFVGALGALCPAMVYVSGAVGGISTIVFGVLEDIRSKTQASTLTSSRDKASQSSRLLAFYRSDAPDHRGRYLRDIMKKDHRWLEDTHDFIQWLFPLFESSQFNSHAPVLDQETLDLMRADPVVRDRVRRSFEMMLNFYGLCFGEQGRIERAENWSAREREWVTPGNHNFRRITRILKFLKAMKFHDEALSFISSLSSIQEEHPQIISKQILMYWTRVAS